ncbi:MAG: hypothetical protein NVV74_12945 [Magnetospirillum sp.]|nr:hypothetical protein [Magnetospirillum sp.]
MDEDLEEIAGNFGLAVRNYLWGVWEQRVDGQYLWHGVDEPLAGLVRTNRTHRSALRSFPVYIPQGYWFIDHDGTTSWHAGAAPVNLVDAHQTRASVAGDPYPVFHEDGFFELQENGGYLWHPNETADFRYVQAHAQRFGYPVHRHNKTFLIHWLGVEGLNAIRNDPNGGSKGGLGVVKYRNYYGLWWDDVVAANGRTYKFYAHLHDDGNLGGCWAEGLNGSGVNPADNPIRVQLQARLIRLISKGWGGNGNRPLVVFSDRNKGWVLP